MRRTLRDRTRCWLPRTLPPFGIAGVGARLDAVAAPNWMICVRIWRVAGRADRQLAPAGLGRRSPDCRVAGVAAD